MSWVHKYNEQGISVLEYKHSGGHPIPLSEGQKQAINQEIIKALAVSATPPPPFNGSQDVPFPLK